MQTTRPCSEHEPGGERTNKVTVGKDRTMSSAWTYQDPKQVPKRGAEAASWYASWRDPDGKLRCKSFGPGARGKSKAEEHCIILRDQLERGTYRADSRKQWADFRAEFKARIVDGLGASTARL